MKRIIEKTSAIGFLASAALIFGLSTSTAFASTICYKKAKPGCKSSTATSLFTGTPTIVCQAGDIVVKIVSKANCAGGGAGPVTVYRCGKFSDGFSYSGNGLTHEFALAKGTWADVLAGHCQLLEYKTK